MVKVTLSSPVQYHLSCEFRPQAQGSCVGLKMVTSLETIVLCNVCRFSCTQHLEASSLLFPELSPLIAFTVMDIAIIAGVITAVAIVLIGLIFVVLCYMYRHKGTYHTNEAKGTEFAESADAALQGDPALQDAGDSGRKEYFI
ncbi:PREDICTED: glycophorin-C-like [Galeopterus variegatus]|uniref:Glycophorin-C-like n=1 Tax=Galeopterus variegatus TaxID=482537 RepID=A0ABM0S9D6_GALVR|nr:PREDICTED: glycophorin-C-like [Galeopterus variegatus]